MTEFENALILKDEPYQAGFFPKVPNFRKEGSAFIFGGGINDDLLVTDRTTTKELRQGRYTRLIEISTRPYLQEIHFLSPSKETAYSFSVYVKAVIQVQKPITFYVNRNLDIGAYFENLFSMDVRKITRKYSILDYDDMDEELTKKLSTYDNFDESTGFSYRISRACSFLHLPMLRVPWNNTGPPRASKEMIPLFYCKVNKRSRQAMTDLFGLDF